VGGVFSGCRTTSASVTISGVQTAATARPAVAANAALMSAVRTSSFMRTSDE
jgi:hypothetical protein